MNTSNDVIVNAVGRFVEKCGGYNQAARELGFGAKEATTMWDMLHGKSCTPQRKQHILDAIAKQSAPLRAELRIPPYFVAWSP